MRIKQNVSITLKNLLIFSHRPVSFPRGVPPVSWLKVTPLQTFCEKAPHPPSPCLVSQNPVCLVLPLWSSVDVGCQLAEWDRKQASEKFAAPLERKENSVRPNAFHSVCLPPLRGIWSLASGASLALRVLSGVLPLKTQVSEFSPWRLRCRPFLVWYSFLSDSLNSLIYAFLIFIVTLMEFQEEIETNLLHKLPYCNQKSYSVVFLSLLPKLTLVIVICPR